MQLTPWNPLMNLFTQIPQKRDRLVDLLDASSHNTLDINKPSVKLIVHCQVHQLVGIGFAEPATVDCIVAVLVRECLTRPADHLICLQDALQPFCDNGADTTDSILMRRVCPDRGRDCYTVVRKVDKDVDVAPVLDTVDPAKVISLR